MKSLIYFFTLLLCTSTYATIDTVTVTNFQYTPQFLEIDLGDTIRFIWEEGNHPTTAGTDGIPDDAFTTFPMNSTNPQHDLILTEEGFYPYFCAFHFTSDNMFGEITVNSTETLTDCGDLFFSEYVEGSGNNKAIEIYNPTTEAVDLSEYEIHRLNNGSTEGFIGTLAGTILAGDVFVIAANNAETPLTATADLLMTDLVLFNGDDVLILLHNSDTLDVFGEIGVQPEDEWSIGEFGTEDGTLVRNPTVLKGQTDWTIGLSEWTSFPQDEFQFLGSHSNNTCTTITALACQDLIISEYIEGAGNNTGLEIYNPTNSDIDLSDYRLLRYNNASMVPSFTENFNGILPAFSTFTIVNLASNAVLLALGDINSDVMQFSGNDVLVLEKNEEAIDQIGTIGVNPGVFWVVGDGGTQNHTLVRNSNVTEGTTDWNIGQTQWTVLPIDDFSNFGNHISDCGSSAPVAGFLNAEVAVEEGDDYLIGLTFSGIAAADITVSVIGGTAENGVDFTFEETTTTITDQTVSPLFLPLSIIDDDVEELAETIVVTLTTTAGDLLLDITELTITIAANDSPLPAFTIGEVITTDAQGVITQDGLECRLTGLVYGNNLTNNGFQFFINDGTGGIYIFTGNPNLNYEVNQGDQIIVEGTIGQFRGQAQITPDNIILVESGLPIPDPQIVTALGEQTEGELITVECVSLISQNDWQTGMGQGFSARAINGEGEFLIRVDGDIDLFNSAAPPLWFTVTGIGSQFTSASQPPLNDGYQILPRSFSDISACGPTAIQTIPFNNISVSPNPSNDFTNIKSDLAFSEIGIYAIDGRLLETKVFSPNFNKKISTAHLQKGTYFLKIIGTDFEATRKIMVN